MGLLLASHQNSVCNSTIALIARALLDRDKKDLHWTWNGNMSAVLCSGSSEYLIMVELPCYHNNMNYIHWHTPIKSLGDSVHL